MLPFNSPSHLRSVGLFVRILCSWLLFLKVWGPFLCCGDWTKAVPQQKNSQLLDVQSLREAAVSDFRDVIEAQVQRFQGNVGLQLTALDAADPVVMPETVRSRKRDWLGLLEKQKEYPSPQQAPRLALSLYTRSYGGCLTAEEKPIPERFPEPLAAPWATASSQVSAGFHFLPSTELLTPLISFSSINLGCPTSLHFQAGFVTCKDYRAVSESQRQGVHAQHAKALSRECDFQRRKQRSKHKPKKSYITFFIPKDSSENSQLCTMLQWFITHRNKKSCKCSCWHFLIFGYFCPAVGLGQLCSASACPSSSCRIRPALITWVCCLTRTAWGIQPKVFLLRKSNQLPSVCFHSHQTVKYL